MDPSRNKSRDETCIETGTIEEDPSGADVSIGNIKKSKLMS